MTKNHKLFAKISDPPAPDWQESLWLDALLRLLHLAGLAVMCVSLARLIGFL